MPVPEHQPVFFVIEGQTDRHGLDRGFQITDKRRLEAQMAARNKRQDQHQQRKDHDNGLAEKMCGQAGCRQGVGW